MSLKRQGFVLVTVLAFLSLVAISLARLAMISLETARHAIATERAVRDKWAENCLRIYALDHAEEIFRQSEVAYLNSQHSAADMNQGLGAVPVKIVLGKVSYNVAIHDENAKLHVERFAAEVSAQAARQAIEQLATTAQLKLLPLADLQTRDQRAGWDRWLALSEFPDKAELMQNTQHITLWGSGKLHWRRASRLSLDTLWKGLFGRAAPEELIQLRQTEPFLPWAEVQKRLDLRESQLQLVNSWFTDQSQTYSVWIQHGELGGVNHYVKIRDAQKRLSKLGYEY